MSWKHSRTVWRKGKDGDNIKVLPIPITTTGNLATISVRDIRSDLTDVEVNALMDLIITNGVFEVKDGEINGKKDAKVIDTTESDFVIS